MMKPHLLIIATVALLSLPAIASSTNDPLSELTGVLKRTKGHFLVIDGSLNSIMLRSRDLKRLPDGTRLWIKGRIKSELVDPTEKGPSPFPKQWLVFMQVEEWVVTTERFEPPNSHKQPGLTPNSPTPNSPKQPKQPLKG